MAAWSGATPIIWGDYIFLNAAEGGKRTAPGHGRRRRGQRGQPPGGRPTSSPPPAEEEEPDPKAEELALWCLDRNTGKVLWKRSLGGSNRQLMKQNMSSPSPVTDGQHVWVMTGTGILKSFDFKGNEIWSRDIQADYGEFGLMWGYASSPCSTTTPFTFRFFTNENGRSVLPAWESILLPAPPGGEWRGRRTAYC